MNLPVNCSRSETIEISLTSASGQNLGVIWKGLCKAGEQLIRLNLEGRLPDKSGLVKGEVVN